MLRVIALVLLAIALVLAGKLAQAHEPYSDWKRPDHPTSSCGDNRDCRPSTAERDADGVWWVRLYPGGPPVPVPPGKIIHKATDGRCHLCASPTQIYCFNPCDVRG